MQAKLKEYVDRELALPESEPYAKWERAFLDKPDTYPRYLRASKFNLQNAKDRIKGTLEWRRSYKPDLIPPTEIAEEAESGKVSLNRSLLSLTLTSASRWSSTASTCMVDQ